MVSVCTVPARGGRSCEHFGGYKTLNRIPLPLPLPLNRGSGSLHVCLDRHLPIDIFCVCMV